jgi:hypothetical protein
MMWVCAQNLLMNPEGDLGLFRSSRGEEGGRELVPQPVGALTET